MKQNVEGTANIVNLSLEHNIKKLGYISSIATLGSSKKIKLERKMIIGKKVNQIHNTP